MLEQRSWGCDIRSYRTEVLFDKGQPVPLIMLTAEENKLWKEGKLWWLPKPRLPVEEAGV